MEYVYVVGENDGPIKVGYTQRPHLRVPSYRVPVIALFEAEKRAGRYAEACIHEDLAAHNTHGEWFDIGAKDALALIVPNLSFYRLRQVDKDNLPTVSTKKRRTVQLTIRMEPTIRAEWQATGPKWQTKMAQYMADLAAHPDFAEAIVLPVNHPRRQRMFEDIAFLYHRPNLQGRDGRRGSMRH